VPGERLASVHLSRFVPRLEALARRILGRGARWAKLAVPAESPKHLAALASLQEGLAGELSVATTGRLAEAGRVLLAGRGAPLTWGAADEGHRGHPDQPLARRLHEVLTIELVQESTRFLAVAGLPVAHSLSPLFHNTVLRGMARNARFVALDVDHLTDLLAVADELRLDGLAVTHPFKAEALEEAASALPGALAAGCANTLLRTPAGWQARNTDWRAASELLPRLLDGWRRARARRSRSADDEEGKTRPAPAARPWVDKAVTACWRRRSAGARPKAGGPVPRVLLLGAGGASRAVAVALREQDVELVVWARRLSAARGMAEELDGAHAVPEPSRTPADLVVNATPVGMPGVEEGDFGIVDERMFRPGSVAVDLAYGAPTSPFREAARKAGAPLVGGEVFFALQARRQAELFAGGEVPNELLGEAARRAGLVLEG
jgi:3-dehydroquinate dehydratase/shikimate dehydrogenase